MESAHKIRQHLDSIISFLAPLLPVANCHMVEFFTHSHWDKLLPKTLRELLDKLDLGHAVEMFWSTAGKSDINDDNELAKWINTARSHCLAVNNDYCLSTEQLQSRIKSWGGTIKPEIRVKDFMTSKKSYEVQTMSHLVASLHEAVSASHCVEAGGGRGHLLVALTLGYGVPSLTVDCDHTTLVTAKQRVKIIQKQWRAIAKKVHNGGEDKVTATNSNLHRFATTYVTKHTDFSDVVREKFPEHFYKDVRLLLTGLHTCGNLGPDSLRIFTSQPSTAAVFNVPCCYHLLTEVVDNSLFDVFQRNYGGGEVAEGFPMSDHLRGYNLGRNARMLAAQSIDRVVNQKQLPSESLLYRAMLQVIIKKHLPNFALSEGKLKRAASKCQNFDEYFKMADAVLKLNLFDSLPNSYLTDIRKEMCSQWKNVVLFYLLRLCLAQVVESVILLDRLLFLVESGCKNVYLVKLFDPVLSPRCHSIVALR